ncbi:MAG: SDR family NAD(P)-dependent oxidoreductase [Rubrobacteraceae bacterium]
MFSGEVAWVTGSSTGIGRAICLAFAERGCDVVVHYSKSKNEAREVVERVEALGRDALLVQGNVADADDVGRMAREIEEHYGRLDILVNNAGSMVERASLEEMTEKLWDRVMSVNLKSVYLCSQAVLPLMKRQGRGRIVNISSISARDGGSANSIAYAAAKGGVSTMTRTMAKELGPQGILVNAVAPGRIDTPFHDQFTPPEKRVEKAGSIPLGREGTAEEVAEAVTFLASSGAGYILGEVLEINGGLLMN